MTLQTNLKNCHTHLRMSFLTSNQTFINKPRKFDKLILSPDKIRIYGIYEDFNSIYKQFLKLITGDTDVDPDNFEPDFLKKVIKSINMKDQTGHKVNSSVQSCIKY